MTGIKTADGIWLDLSPDTEFELTIENPLLRDDRIPSSWSTDITFPPTVLNKRVFSYLGALMTEPAKKKLKATIVSGGLGLFDGSLEYDSIDEDGNLVYTFSVRNPDDDWDMKLNELPGLLYDESSGYDYGSFLEALKEGKVASLHLPLIINESLVAEPSCGSYIYRGDTGQGGSGSGSTGTRLADSDWGNTDMKYRNSPAASSHQFTIPAVDIKRLLECAIGKDAGGDLDEELSKLVVFATWWTRFFPDTKTREFTYDVGNALPDLSLRDLVKSVCSMFCAAVFIDRTHFLIHTANAILGSPEVTDWTDKVSDSFTSECIEAQGYELSYSNGEKEASGILEKDSDADSIEELLFDATEEYKAIGHSATGDIYSIKYLKTEVTVAGTKDHPEPRVETIHEILCDRISEPGPVTSGTGEDNISVEIGLCLARCVPARHFWFDFPENSIKYSARMAALLPLPSVESERPSETYVAVLHEGQACDKGLVENPAGGDSRAGLDITPGALFANYHKSFAEWLGKDRQRLKVELNLSIYEATGFRMWRKVQILGRTFLVEKLTIRFHSGTDDVETSADLICL